jgi:hypothetical protein
VALIRNLATLRNMPTWGSRLVEAFADVQRQLSNLSVQSNGSLSSPTNAPPPQINALHVDGGAGIYHAYVTDNNPNLYRGVEYTAEYSQNPDFSDFHVVHMGPSRDHRMNIGLPGPLYWRAYSGYGPSSPPSTAVYHGGGQPVGVNAGGAVAPPLKPGQGSGTNFPTQGAGGYGNLPWRGSTPPRRV